MELLAAHSQTLYLVSLVVLCSVLLAVSIRASQVFIGAWKLEKSVKSASQTTSVNVTSSSYLPVSVLKRMTLISAISTMFSCAVVTWTVFDRFREKIVNKDGSHVIARYSDVQFCLEHKGIEFSFKACQPIPKDIVAGATLTTLRFRYDTHLDCDDWMSETPVGYTAWRNPDDTPVLSNVPRPKTTGRSCAAPAPDRSTEAALPTEARARR